MRNTADNRSPLGLALALAPSLAGSVGSAWAASACANNQPAAQAGYPTPAPNVVPVQQAPGYGASPAPQPAVLAASRATLGATPAVTLSQPNALALPCASDTQCLTHRCNVAVGKCAWPCQTDTDCLPGNTCIAPTCLPKLQ